MAARSARWRGRQASPRRRRERWSRAGRRRTSLLRGGNLALKGLASWLDLLPSAFEIGRFHFRSVEQFPAGAGQRDQPVDHDIAAVRQLKRMEGVLLDQEHGEAVFGVELF